MPVKYVTTTAKGQEEEENNPGVMVFGLLECDPLFIYTLYIWQAV